MSKPIQVDFVSDVVCPWCVIGLKEMETALARLGDSVQVDIQLQPFELNPAMPAEGQNIADHMLEKFGRRMDESSGVREALQARAKSLGFTMGMTEDSRIYNSFDAHRLLHWAGLVGDSVPLKHALFRAYFTDNRNIADIDVLVGLAESVGLDGVEARAVLESGRYAEEVRQAEESWRRAGINSVPSIVINRKYLISGGQTADIFEQAFRQVAAEAT